MKEMIDRIVAGLMKQYGVSHDDAVEATHEAYVCIHGKDYNEKAELSYWYVTAKNNLLDSIKKRNKEVELEEHHTVAVYQPEPERSRTLDKLINKLEPNEWVLLEMVRHGLPSKLIAESHGWERSTLRSRKSELMRKIKTLILFLVCFVPVLAQAQSHPEFVRPADFRFHVTVGEDTVSTRSLDYKAYQDGVVYKQMFCDQRVVIHPLGVEIRNCFNQVADTLYIINTVYEKLVEVVDWQHRQSAPDEHQVTIEVEHQADELHLRMRACGQLFVESLAMIPCSEMLYIEVIGMKGDRTVTVRDSVDLKAFNDFFLTTIEEIMPFAGGTGVEGDPYLVHTPEALNAVRNDLSAHYLQIADIDLTFDTQDPSGLYYNNGAGWVPIGNSLTVTFTGTYGFNTFNIHGMFINRSGNFQGLFGVTTGNAKVHSGSFTGASVNGSSFSALLVGRQNTDDPVIEFMKVEGTINGVNDVGLISGWNRSGYIENCYGFGDVVANRWVAMIGGDAGSGFNTYAVGTSFGADGRNWGGVKGAGALSDSFYDEDVAGVVYENDPEFATSTQDMQDIDTYLNAGWDIVLKSDHDGDKETAIWYIDDGNDYPRLWFEFEGEPAGETIEAEKGSYLLTGKNAELIYDRILEVNKGLYEIDGKTALLLSDFIVSAQKGFYALDGKNADLLLLQALSLIAEKGTYSIEGKDVSIKYDRVLEALKGNFTLEGKDANLFVSIVLSAQKGSYTLSGKEAEFLKTYLLQAQKGEYITTGKTASLLYAQIFSVDKGSYSVTGKQADLIIGEAATIASIIELNSTIFEEISLSSTITEELFLNSTINEEIFLNSIIK